MEDRLDMLKELIGKMGPRDNTEAWNLVHEELVSLRKQITDIYAPPQGKFVPDGSHNPD